ncbi:MAG TPA: hypothetical protein VLV78_15080 [Thermoanaerobaculia bacterium]|nr:hypothetical protein [Thermoanaerobaculia bacterium]
MAVGAIAGGYLGARAARKLGLRFVRASVIIIRLVMTIALGIKAWP